ncbi:hypothetical protein V2J09_009166 [Rumex salicifolius]
MLSIYMEAEGESTPSKPSKIASSAQETPTLPSYPDWSGSLQAYYSGGAPPPIFASPVPSSPHPYMWGGQHPLMSPYGTPVPYPAMKTMIDNKTTAKVAQGKTEVEGKSQESKAPAKKSKGHSVLGSSKTEDNGRAASGSGNGAASLSAESGTDDSLDASDENNNLELAGSSKKGSFHQMLAEGVTAQNNDGASIQTSVLGKPVVSIAATNLNIGMGSWNGSPADTMKSRQENGVTSAAQDHQWMQDERELKRQKRKQSNRESARRSRLRKQAECEELQRKVDSLSGENQSLTQELQRLAEECNKITAENTSIKVELTQMYGPEILVNLDGSSRSEPGSKGNS